jgi:hypothetical protein
LVSVEVITIIRPETVVRWHRAGFRRYWRWKSRSLGGRPQIAADLPPHVSMASFSSSASRSLSQANFVRNSRVEMEMPASRSAAGKKPLAVIEHQD